MKLELLAVGPLSVLYHNNSPLSTVSHQVLLKKSKPRRRVKEIRARKETWGRHLIPRPSTIRIAKTKHRPYLQGSFTNNWDRWL